MPPTINVDSIPEFQKNALADMALDLTRACFEIPGMEERYQQWLIGYRERKRQRAAEKGDEAAKKERGPLRWHGNDPRHKDLPRS